MKRIIFVIVLAGIVLSCLAAESAEPRLFLPSRLPDDEPAGGGLVLGPRVKVQGRQLLEDFNRDGIYEPYLIKGVGYSPYPIGALPSQWGTCEYIEQGYVSCDVTDVYDRPELMDRDFSLLAAMHVNTIRVWSGVTQTLLDKAQQYGLKVIAGFWVDTAGSYYCNGVEFVYYPPALLNPSDASFGPKRQEVVNGFKAYVSNFKDHPAILFWAIGNENDAYIYDTDALAYWFSLTNQMAYEAHLSEDPTGGTNYHPVAVVNGDIDKIDVHGSHDDQMASVNIWGANVYRGQTFGTLFSDYALKSAKPLWISEYGIDAWHSNDVENPDDGQEDEFTQAEWDSRLWDEVVLNNNVCVGATLMEYSDEWWKPSAWQSPFPETILTHNTDGFGPIDTSCPIDGEPDWFPSLPDHFFNEEWFGIMAISPNSTPYYPDNMTPREVYYTLQRRFECSGFNKYYAGPDNNKSCDGTDACCSSSTMKAKNSSCVLSCTNPCFLAGTTILMADDSLKPIEEIKIGDLVKSADEKDKIVVNKVTELFAHPETKGYLLVETSDGKQLRVTSNHLVKSGDDYKQIGTLTIDSPLTLFKDGKLIETKIISMRKIDTTQTVYNFEVENSHTYFADDYLVHNRKPNVYYMEAAQDR